LTTDSRTFTDGKFVRKYLEHRVQEICPEKKTVFNTFSLSRATTMRRLEDINNDLVNSETKQKKMQNFL
jgi:hypothetical protein